MAEGKVQDSRFIQGGLYAVASCCVLAAIGHGIWPDRIDDKTAMFLGLAAIILIIREVGKIEFPGWRFERVKELQEQVKQVDKKVELIEDRGLLPGRPERVGTDARRATRPHGWEEEVWSLDPHRGKFGGSPQANGRVLEAKITPVAGPRSAACDVHLCVRSIDPNRPLKGKVAFYLHPTFREYQQYEVPVIDGVAEDTVTSWGVFTVGAVADDGETKLELNLANVKGGTKKFYQQ